METTETVEDVENQVDRVSSTTKSWLEVFTLHDILAIFLQL